MPAAQTAMEKKKRSFAMPHVFVILTIIMLLVWAISFFVPSGNFERVLDPNSGREIVNPDVFNFVEKEYIMPDTFFQTFYNGIVGGINIMANLLICSGVLGFLESTGAFSAGLTVVDEATAEMCGQVIYPAAVMKNSANPDAAKAFLDFLSTDEAMACFEAVGFSPMA